MNPATMTPEQLAERERCPTCDRPEATEADLNSISEGEGEHLCWGLWDFAQCEKAAVDWRAVVMRSREALRARLEDAEHKRSREARIRANNSPPIVAVMSWGSACGTVAAYRDALAILEAKGQ